MNEFRVLISILLFCISSYLVYDLIANGFDWIVLVACVLGYVAVHFIWPKHSNDESKWYDIVELIIDFPFRVIAGLLRLIGRKLKDSNSDIGIDL